MNHFFFCWINTKQKNETTILCRSIGVETPPLSVEVVVMLTLVVVVVDSMVLSVDVVDVVDVMDVVSVWILVGAVKL